MTTRNKFSPEVRERAVRMVGEHRADYGSEWGYGLRCGLRCGYGDSLLSGYGDTVTVRLR